MRSRTAIAIVATLGVIALCAAAAILLLRAGAFGRGVRLRADDAALVAEGQAVYVQHCAVCHGAQLEGQPDWKLRDESGLLPAPPHDETGHTWHHDDETLFNITKHGVQLYAGADYESAMPAYDGVLTDRQIVAALSYIRSTWPADVQEIQAGRNR